MTGDARQLTIDFPRGEQLFMRRTVALPPDEKLLLMLIDDHIGKARSWKMRVDDLVRESGYSQSKTYKILKALQDRTFVFQEATGTPGVREFFICWENIREAIDRPEVKPSGNARPRQQPAEMSCSGFSNREKKFSNGESGFSIGENNSPLENRTLYIAQLLTTRIAHLHLLHLLKRSGRR